MTNSHDPPPHLPLGPCTFELALSLCPEDWELSHLIRLSPTSWEAIAADPHYVVVATGGTPGEALLAAWNRTLDAGAWMPKALLASAMPRRSLDDILGRQPLKPVLRRI